jgi:hypothetical protein
VFGVLNATLVYTGKSSVLHKGKILGKFKSLKLKCFQILTMFGRWKATTYQSLPTCTVRGCVASPTGACMCNFNPLAIDLDPLSTSGSVLVYVEVSPAYTAIRY